MSSDRYNFLVLGFTHETSGNQYEYFRVFGDFLTHLFFFGVTRRDLTRDCKWWLRKATRNNLGVVFLLVKPGDSWPGFWGSRHFHWNDQGLEALLLSPVGNASRADVENETGTWKSAVLPDEHWMMMVVMMMMMMMMIGWNLPILTCGAVYPLC